MSLPLWLCVASAARMPVRALGIASQLFRRVAFSVSTFSTANKSTDKVCASYEITPQSPGGVRPCPEFCAGFVVEAFSTAELASLARPELAAGVGVGVGVA